MITEKIFDRITDKNLEECLVFGLASGLVFGLASGLVFGLAFGLVFGLAFGLVSGLVVTLVNYSSLYLPIPIWVMLIGIFLISNVINFILKDKGKISKARFFFQKEILGFVEVSAVVFNLIGYLTVLSKVDLMQLFSTIIEWMGYLGVAALALGLIWVVFELKYWIYTSRKR